MTKEHPAVDIFGLRQVILAVPRLLAWRLSMVLLTLGGAARCAGSIVTFQRLDFSRIGWLISISDSYQSIQFGNCPLAFAL
jgi:hypothetical protein